MSSPAIDKYYTSVQKIRDYGGSGKETAIRSAFYTLLNHYAEKKDLILITELSVEGKLGRKVTPDGTLKNALRLDYGYWESKDEADEELDGLILLKGIPTEAWAYKLGNRSTLEWVLDQYKEKTPKAPTIR
ncbi:MAG TPA: hypothetical protein PL070_15430, partial [Flavobacteriales bacterium]|nr:hypothetical protein [Flavobacteriales bacterium]